ncbi:hypothetical protein PsorP6_000128 [Peronosclerospora sorghi]|uniref:Uncharacterized protein n=1 Tax=Peronosclerospora sorghi TaxID=230839 RepID=A0ACC0WXJ4_9STRA|nr:hypothetical protein PsorP6_000128 [Peronosclerospora sorghi]
MKIVHLTELFVAFNLNSVLLVPPEPLLIHGLIPDVTILYITIKEKIAPSDKLYSAWQDIPYSIFPPEEKTYATYDELFTSVKSFGHTRGYTITTKTSSDQGRKNWLKCSRGGTPEQVAEEDRSSTKRSYNNLRLTVSAVCTSIKRWFLALDGQMRRT